METVRRNMAPSRYPFHSPEALMGTLRKTERGWLPARPEPAPLRHELRGRIVAAWAVLRGRAAAVEWR